MQPTAQSGSSVGSQATAQVLGGQLTNDLTSVGNVVNNLPAGGLQTTPAIGGSALLGQPNIDQNLLMPGQG